MFAERSGHQGREVEEANEGEEEQSQEDSWSQEGNGLSTIGPFFTIYSSIEFSSFSECHKSVYLYLCRLKPVTPQRAERRSETPSRDVFVICCRYQSPLAVSFLMSDFILLFRIVLILQNLLSGLLHLDDYLCYQL